MSGTEQTIPVSQYRGGVPRHMTGFGVSYRAIKMRVDGLGKPPEQVTFHDLWMYNERGVLVPKEPERVVMDSVVHNKFLKRGISWLSHLMLRSKAGVSEAERMLPDIDSGTRAKNPFRALVLVSDDNPLVHPGDARVDWNESDGSTNSKIASSVAGAFTPAGYGIRGVLLDDATGTLQVVQVRYPDTTYYSQLEYTVFAQANASAVETGAKGIDNFPIKSLGIAYGIQAGYDDVDSQWASRAVLGLMPTLQAWKWPERVGIPASGDKGTDRPYRHENYIYDDAGAGSVTALHKYAGTETIPGNGEGYVASNEESDGSLAGDYNVAITPGADQFFATGRLITLSNASFVAQHAIDRAMLVVDTTALGGANTGSFTIKRVVSPTQVEVFEAVTNEGPGNVDSASIVSRHTGDKVFDGRVENEGKVYQSADDGDLNGTVVMGQNWRSADAPSGHFVGRVWNATKNVRGVRIICGKGTSREHCVDRFKVQYLDPTANGGSPRPAQETDWLDVAGQDYTGASGEVLNIYPAGQYGYEYHFGVAVSTQGIRITSVQNESQDGYVEIQQLLVYEEADDHVIASPNNVLRVAVDGASTFKAFTVPEVAATKDVQDLADALNQVLLGSQLEAVRTEFGFLLIRGTVEGDNSDIELDTNGNGSTINASLGLNPSGIAEKTGESLPITKAYDEALTLIVTADYTVDLPWAE